MKLAQKAGRQARVNGNAAAGPIVDREEIAKAAYQLYLKRGRIDGHDLEDWIKAEAILRDRYGTNTAA
jgi:hypothetical protein